MKTYTFDALLNTIETCLHKQNDLYDQAYGDNATLTHEEYEAFSNDNYAIKQDAIAELRSRCTPDPIQTPFANFID